MAYLLAFAIVLGVALGKCTSKRIVLVLEKFIFIVLGCTCIILGEIFSNVVCSIFGCAFVLIWGIIEFMVDRREESKKSKLEFKSLYKE